jgi:glycosyltransferase involved in cell wall biosynthesis
MHNSNLQSVTVVVPTFSRGEPLRATLNALLASASAGLDFVEILVVDDGSPLPAAPLVNSLPTASPFSLRCIRQPNRGPGAARNTGFREARGRIVIFVDDDIIAPPSLIQQHLRAHACLPHSVICGLSTLIQPRPPTPLFRFISSLSGDEPLRASEQEFLDTDQPNSQHISVEREMFDAASAIYHDDLFTPAAEEFGLAYRLQQAGIRLVFAVRITARHDQPLDLAGVCRQQYKHALGTAEVMKKYPAARSLPALERIIRANREATRGLTLKALKRGVLRCLASAPLRKRGLRAIEMLQDFVPLRSAVLPPIYRAIVSAHYHAGLRDGSRREWS